LLAERGTISVREISSALIVGAKALYSEDLQDGQVIDGKLRVANPFRKPRTQSR
jgi:predicted nucleic acid-binding protein